MRVNFQVHNPIRVSGAELSFFGAGGGGESTGRGSGNAVSQLGNFGKLKLPAASPVGWQ